MTHEKWKN